MADLTTPPTEPQPAGGTTTPAAPPVTPDQGQADWEQRYKGMTRVLSDRDRELADLKGQFSTTAGTAKQLQDQLAAAQAGWDAQKLNYEKLVTEAATAKAAAEKAHADAQAELGKFKLLKDFPDLLPVADTIPNISDPEVLKQHLTTLQAGVDVITQKKAERLTAGLTPGPTTPTSAKFTYTSADQWAEALKQAAGKPEFKELSGAYEKWFRATFNT